MNLTVQKQYEKYPKLWPKFLIEAAALAFIIYLTRETVQYSGLNEKGAAIAKAALLGLLHPSIKMILDTSSVGLGYMLLETLAMLAEGDHSIEKCDLTSEEDRNNLISQVGKLDGVVNCAGVGMTLPFKFCTEKELGRIMNINFFGPVYLVQSLVKSNKINKKASIVYMASIDGTVTGHIGNSCYAASSHQRVPLANK